MRRSSIALFILIALMAMGCKTQSTATVTPEEMNVYIEQNPQLSEMDKSCILNGEFKIGMGKETVRFLLGDPNAIDNVTKPWGPQEVWTYKKGGKKIFTIEENGVVGIETE